MKLCIPHASPAQARPSGQNNPNKLEQPTFPSHPEALPAVSRAACLRDPVLTHGHNFTPHLTQHLGVTIITWPAA